MQADTASRSWLAQKAVCLGPMGGTTYTTVQEGEIMTTFWKYHFHTCSLIIRNPEHPTDGFLPPNGEKMKERRREESLRGETVLPVFPPV